ncbi:unnamed protein product [Rotaria magnacalcarata]|uniref:Microbial-type PARG catalytic domain-containing protein n=2 Tax=Rotaria magnacalcarata TaxID=392030 RepID=A0A816L8L1_9BILA|nr:unnamed protein product [Rotaria magnacalcarata]
MEESDRSTAFGDSSLNTNLQSYSTTGHFNFTYQTMPDPLAVYIPVASLTKSLLCSILCAVSNHERIDWNHSRRTLLVFLLALNKRLEELKEIANARDKISDQITRKLDEIRQWLVYEDHDGTCREPNWNELRETYQKMTADKVDDTWTYYGGHKTKPYYELTISVSHPDIERSRLYMDCTRPNGFQSDELKLYWNAEQLEQLCPKAESQLEKFLQPLYDPSDADAVEALRQHPVWQRNHHGKITYVTKGIEKAVFDVPKDAQIILLSFADEQSPGGGYLIRAWTQEEIILYNSDAYRSLLDLKYGRMGGGYAIPEFGLAYVRNICFFHRDTQERRLTDMLVANCYCIGAAELYRNPKNKTEWKETTLAKFHAFIAAAVANTKGDGSNTYLLLGPIGTGAFGNDVQDIAKLFREILQSKIMGSNGPIRQAFSNIWFVCTDAWKNEIFEEIFSKIEV